MAGAAAPPGPLAVTRLACHIEANALRGAWPVHAACEPVSFRAEPGHIVWLSGASGSGKSSLLSVLLGLHRPASGQVRRRIGPAAIGETDRALSAWRSQHVGVVPQGAGLIDCLSLEEHLRLLNIDEASREKFSVRFGLGERRFARADELSGGEARRAVFVRALAPTPAALLLDEPTAGLDATAATWVWQAVAQAAADGAAVVVASHDASIAQAASAQPGCTCQQVPIRAAPNP